MGKQRGSDSVSLCGRERRKLRTEFWCNAVLHWGSKMQILVSDTDATFRPKDGQSTEGMLARE